MPFLRRRLATAAATVLLLASTAGCGGEGTSGSGGALDGVTVTGEFGSEPTVKVDDVDVDEAESATLIEGDGDEITADSTVEVKIAIVNATTGDRAISTFANNAPESLQVSQLPAPVADKLIGRTVGTRIVVLAPVSDIWGDQGNPQLGLGPGDDLVWVVDVVGIAPPPVPALDGPRGKAVEPPATAPRLVLDGDQPTGFDFSGAPATPPSSLQVIPLVKGDGAKITGTDNLVLDYLGVVYGGDTPFDESYSGDPVRLTLGSVIPGWTQGLAGVTVGSRVVLVIPPDLGYGAQGSGEDIPPDATLVFVVDVLGIE